VRVGGRWNYLFRAVDKHGPLIDFMLSDRRNTRAAYRFLRKALKTMSDYPPERITTDKLASSLWAPHDCIIAQEQESRIPIPGFCSVRFNKGEVRRMRSCEIMGCRSRCLPCS
jgi:transposase-like protein